MTTTDATVQHRIGRLRLTVQDAAGRPLRDADVRVEQRAHAFGFGDIGFDVLPLVGGPVPDGVEDVEAFGTTEGVPLEDACLSVFNRTTPPFSWGGTSRSAAGRTPSACAALRSGSSSAA